MANVGETLTSLSNTLRKFYRKPMANAIPKKVMLLDMLYDKSPSEEIGGNALTAYWPVATARGSWGSVLDEGGDLDAALPELFGEYNTSISHNSWGFEFTDRAQIANRKQSHSYLGNLVKHKMKMVKDTAAKKLAIYAHGNGDGLVGIISAVSTNELTLDGTLPDSWVERGMELTCRSAKSGSATERFSNGVNRVVGVEYGSNKIHMTDATGASTTNKYLHINGDYDKTVLYGLEYLIGNTGTRQGVNRATAGNEWAQSKVFSCGGAALSEALFQEFSDLFHDFSPNSDYPGIFYGNARDRRWLFLALSDRHRFTEKKLTVLGHHGIEIATGDGNRAFMADPLAQFGRIYALDLSKMCVIWAPGEKGGKFWDYGGGNLVVSKTGSSAGGTYAAAYQGTWTMRLQLICDDFEAQGYMHTFISP